MKVAASCRMSTTKRRTSSSSSFLARTCCSFTSSAFLDRGAAGCVVSSTETRSFLPPSLKIFVSIITSSAVLRWPICAFASSIATACSCTSRPARVASSAAYTLSAGVVVGDRNSSESEMMHDSMQPATFCVIFGTKPAAFARAYRMLPAEQSGRISISSGSALVRPLSLWWSTIEWIVDFSMPSGSSAGLLVSTMDTIALGTSSVSSGGTSMPSFFST
mmetsp:Transcript_53717/g.151313  ORF Transcript_53717/g.151313 Transcript_53717/m.151313 type:complete len:219 (+) Transcript_53717:225-881(+)